MHLMSASVIYCLCNRFIILPSEITFSLFVTLFHRLNIVQRAVCISICFGWQTRPIFIYYETNWAAVIARKLEMVLSLTRPLLYTLYNALRRNVF